MKRFLFPVAVLLLSTSLYATGFVEYKDVVETARDVGHLGQFVAALEATDLDDMLVRSGPFTILVPTDEAFSNLPERLLDVLYQRPSVFRQVLSQHIIPGNVRLRELEGVAEGNIDASNGVVHIIDEVLFPASIDTRKLLLPDIMDILRSDGRFTTFVRAIEAAGLVGRLRGEGPYTVFAPTDDAFSDLPAEAVAQTLSDADLVGELVLRHVVSTQLYATEVAEMGQVINVEGDRIVTHVDRGSIYIDSVQLVITDMQTGNGLIHAVDAIIPAVRSDESANR